MKIKLFAFALLIALFLPGAGELPADLQFKSLAVAPDGTVWIGTNQYLYYKSPDGELQKHSGQAGSVTNTNLAISDIAINGNEMLLATTNGAVLYTFNGNELLTGTTYTPDKQIRAVAMNNDAKWIATTDSFYIMRDGKLVNIRYKDVSQNARIWFNAITDIELCKDTTYITTTGYNTNTETQSAQFVEVFKKDVDGYTGATTYESWPSNIFISPLCVTTNSNGEQWYGTKANGVHWHLSSTYLYKEGIDPEIPQWDAITTKDGLLDNKVDAIALSSDGDVYAGTPKGISKITRKNNTLSIVKNYALKSGKGIIDISTGGADNKVYAISAKGFYVLSEDDNLDPIIVSSDKAAIATTAVSIYPNPASDYVTIQIEGNKAVSAKISLLSINGAKVRQLYQGQIDEGLQTLSFPLNGLAPGSYICSMNIGADYHACVVVVR